MTQIDSWVAAKAAAGKLTPEEREAEFRRVERLRKLKVQQLQDCELAVKQAQYQLSLVRRELTDLNVEMTYLTMLSREQNE